MVNPRSPGDEELVRAAQQGRLSAFTELYEHYFPLVYNRVRCSIPIEDVEDVSQEVFIAVMKSLKSFRYEASFSTWLRTLVSRQVADYYRRRKPTEKDSVSINGDNPDRFQWMGAFHNSESTDNLIILRQCMAKLPDNYREVILLRFADGLQFDEIAQVLGQSLEATKSLFRRAIKALRTQMTENA